MPRPLTALDPLPQVPAVDLAWWDDMTPAPPWTEVVTQRAQDAIRTAALVDWDARVRVSGNTPLQLVGTTGATRVWEANNPRSVFWNPASWIQLPLPPKVWISTNNDHTWFGVDPLRKWYYEASAFGPMIGGTWWRANIVRVFNLSRQWTEQAGSISASRIPVWPLVPSCEGLSAGAGGVRHALAFVAAGYGDGAPQWPSRATDGYIPGHPLVNGSRLRLTRKAVERLTPQANTAQDLAVLWALENHGAYCVDKTGEDAGHALRMPKDPRLNVTLSLRLTDLEVVF